MFARSHLLAFSALLDAVSSTPKNSHLKTLLKHAVSCQMTRRGE